jgi:hypothetical protein
VARFTLQEVFVVLIKQKTSPRNISKKKHTKQEAHQTTYIARYIKHQPIPNAS